MTRQNPMNEYSRAPEETQREVEPPITKAKVVESAPHNDASEAWHQVRVRPYGESSPTIATVLSSGRGTVNPPVSGDDVAVGYGPDGRAYVIGYWYRNGRDAVAPPDYAVGDHIIGSPNSNSYIAIRRDGHIDIITEGNKRVDIDNQSAAAYLTTDFSAPSQTAYSKIPFATVEYNKEGLFDTTTHDMTVHADGLHRIDASVEIAEAGQNNVYQLAIFKNGSIEKRKSRQSSVNEPLSIDIGTTSNLDKGDIIDVRLKQQTGSAKTVQGLRETTEFTIRRNGI